MALYRSQIVLEHVPAEQSFDAVVGNFVQLLSRQLQAVVRSGLGLGSGHSAVPEHIAASAQSCSFAHTVFDTAVMFLQSDVQQGNRNTS